MRLASAATVVIATAACGSSSAAPARTHPSCGPARAKTIAVNARARIYVAGDGVYGCADSVRHAYLLGHRRTTRPGQDRIGPLALGGTNAGYASSRMGVDTVAAEVIVRRLDTGRVVHDASALTRPPGPEFFESVDAIEVTGGGAVAWIATGGSIIRHGFETEVNRIDARGEQMLDAGAGIDPRSLRLRGTHLTWRDHGAIRSANLV